MTLHELVNALRSPPKKGAYEFVRAPDGLHHIVFVTDVHDLQAPTGPTREYGFMSWCGATNNCTAEQLETVEDITCLKCMQWGNK